MSIQTELTRITDSRNKLRNAGINLGIAISTDNLTELATKFAAIENQGAVNANVKEGDTFTIPEGYHNGSGTVSGVAGGGAYDLQHKTIVPTKAQQSVVPDAGYFGLSSVTVEPIPDAYQDVSSVTASASDVLATKLFVPANGVLTGGTMPNNGAISATIDGLTKSSYIIPAGYHSGMGAVSITDDIELALAGI